MKKTPWQKVHAKFGISASALATALNRHRSKVTRHLRDDLGLINGRDQERLMKLAKARGVDLKPTDLLPE